MVDELVLRTHSKKFGSVEFFTANLNAYRRDDSGIRRVGPMPFDVAQKWISNHIMFMRLESPDLLVYNYSLWNTD